jgi:hypothetical protein
MRLKGWADYCGNASSKFKYVRREANGAAHKLAHRALKTQESVVLRMDMPDEIRSIIIAEATDRGSPDPCISPIPEWIQFLWFAKKMPRTTAERRRACWIAPVGSTSVSSLGIHRLHQKLLRWLASSSVPWLDLNPQQSTGLTNRVGRNHLQPSDYSVDCWGSWSVLIDHSYDLFLCPCSNDASMFRLAHLRTQNCISWCMWTTTTEPSWDIQKSKNPFSKLIELSLYDDSNMIRN